MPTHRRAGTPLSLALTALPGGVAIFPALFIDHLDAWRVSTSIALVLLAAMVWFGVSWYSMRVRRAEAKLKELPALRVKVKNLGIEVDVMRALAENNKEFRERLADLPPYTPINRPRSGTDHG